MSIADLNPLKGDDPLRQRDFNYFYTNRQVATVGPVTAADLVGPDGRCAFAPPPMAPSMPEPAAAAPPPAAEPINPGSNRALYFTAGPEANPGAARSNASLPPEISNGQAGIALQMTECQVVAVAGYTDRVEIGGGARGEREVTLTYISGNHPGIYRFQGGRLKSMERVAEPAQPKKPARVVKKQAKQQAKQQ